MENKDRALKVKLSDYAVQILKDYAATYGVSPTQSQRQELCRMIQMLPGHDAITDLDSRVNNWFQRRRQAKRVASTYPSLTQGKIENLQTLFDATPQPTDKLIELWAKAVSAKQADVFVWVRERLADTAAGPSTSVVRPSPLFLLPPDTPGTLFALDGDSPISTSFVRPHLPTPSQSISPEPSYGASAYSRSVLVKDEAAVSPVLHSPSAGVHAWAGNDPGHMQHEWRSPSISDSAHPSSEPAEQQQQQLPPSADIPSEEAKPTQKPPPALPAGVSEAEKLRLRECMHRAREQTGSDIREEAGRPPPKTMKEFCAAFAPHEATMLRWLAALGEGT